MLARMNARREYLETSAETSKLYQNASHNFTDLEALIRC